MKQKGRTVELALAGVIVLVAACLTYYAFFDPRIRKPETFRKEMTFAIRSHDVARTEGVMGRNRTPIDPLVDEELMEVMVEADDTKVAELWVRNAPPERLAKLLEFSISTPRPKMTQFFVEKGADPNARDSLLGGTLLFRSRHDPEVQAVMRSHASAETLAMAEAEERRLAASELAKLLQPGVSCNELRRYAEAKGYNFFERAAIIEQAMRGGACK